MAAIARVTQEYLDKWEVEQPDDVLKPSFDAGGFLQAVLKDPSVAVNGFHPVMKRRKAHQYANLMLHGLASPEGPNSQTHIRQGVRLKGSFDNRVPNSQWWFWARDLARLGKTPSRPPKPQPLGSGGVANPEYERGRDCEGIVRRSSNHVAQQMPGPWGAEVGYASDDRTLRGTSAEAWRPVHELMRESGLDWPLKPGVPGVRIVEMWHHQAQGLDMCWYPGPFCMLPGWDRPIMKSFKGDDVGKLQRQLAAFLGLMPMTTGPDPTPAGAVKIDNWFGPTGEALTREAQKRLGTPVTGIWMRRDQTAYTKAGQRRPDPIKPPKQPPVPPTTGNPPLTKAGLLDELEKARTIITNLERRVNG